MKELAALLNQMRAAGVIQDYALFGAVAQMRYTEPVATLDADVLVAIPENRLDDALARIYEFCEARGYRPEGEAIRVGAWPTQFIPVFSPLTGEALLQAEIADFEGIPLRVVKPEYLAVIALSTGRAKDFARVLALLESGSVRQDTIEPLPSGMACPTPGAVLSRGSSVTDIRDLVERQARWQRGRAALPWPEKIRLIEMIHESIKALRAGARTGSERPTGEAENPSVRS